MECGVENFTEETYGIDGFPYLLSPQNSTDLVIAWSDSKLFRVRIQCMY